MRRKTIITAAIGVTVILLFVGFLRWAAHEPAFDGKPVRVLVDAIDTRSHGPRELAVEQLQASAPVAIPYIIDALQEDSGSLRNRINAWLARVRPNLPPTLQKLIPVPRGKMRSDRRTWIDALGHLGPKDKRVIAALKRELGHKDSEVRFFASYRLGSIATNWLDQPHSRSDFIQTLTQLLNDPAPNVRSSAAHGLSQCEAHARSAVPLLLQRLSDGDPSRNQALRALTYIGGDPATLLPAITNLLQHTQNLTRAYAAYVICHFTDELDRGLPVLVGILHETGRDRALAAALLGRLGPRARVALPDLEQVLADDDIDMRIKAATAIWKISGETSRPVQALRSALREGERFHRTLAPIALGEMGTAAADAVPELIAALKDKDFLIRRNAAEALGMIGPPAGAAISELRVLREDSFPSIRSNAIHALNRISQQ